MMFNRDRTRVRVMNALAGTVLCAAMFAGAASAQNSDDAKPTDPSQTLRGPGVQDRDVPGTSSTFGDGEMEPGKRERPVPHFMFMQAVRSLSDDDAPANVRAGKEQADQLAQIDETYRDARRAYMDEHRDEIRDLMQQIRPEGAQGPRARQGDRPSRGRDGQQGGPPDGGRGPQGAPGERGRSGPGGRGGPGGPGGPGGDEMGDGPGPRIDPSTLNDEQRAAFEKLKAIREAGPSAEECHAKIWEALSAEQQGYVEGRISEMQQQAMERRGDRRNEEHDKSRGRGGQRGGPDGNSPGGPRGNRPGRGQGQRGGQRAGLDRFGAPGGAPGPSGPPDAGFGAGFGRGPAGGPVAGFEPGARGAGFGGGQRFGANPQRFAGPAGAPGPDAPRFERLAQRLESLPPDVRERVIDRIEMALDRMEGRFERPAPPPMGDLSIPE